MRRGIFWLGVVYLGLISSTTACDAHEGDSAAGSASASAPVPSETTDGTGALDIGDLRTPAVPDHFTGMAVPLSGRVAARTNGCVTVVVDGVERLPIWPEGTEVTEDSGGGTRYVVTLPGGLRLVADGGSGDGFTADGIVDQNTGPFLTASGERSEKIQGFLDFCGVPSAPVSFPDAATFAVRGS
ncbi:MAG TPA: hypothetical protein VN408_18480 [Actinoplanes sp.]|nr:hypothetical protein [Actinoplanes sp.]